jgi:uncharacterized membrane protein
MQSRNAVTITIGLLGAAKLVLDAFGVHIISDGQINDIANGVASLVTVVGVYMTHNKDTSAPAGESTDSTTDKQ